MNFSLGEEAERGSLQLFPPLPPLLIQTVLGAHISHWYQLKLKAISGRCFTHHLTPSSPNPFSQGRRGIKSQAPLSLGRGAGGEGKTLSPSGFHVKLTRMHISTPLPDVANVTYLQENSQL